MARCMSSCGAARWMPIHSRTMRRTSPRPATFSTSTASPWAPYHLSETLQRQKTRASKVRAEAFNVFNSYWMSGGSGVNNEFAHSPDNSNFGQIIKGTVVQGASNFSREIQIGFKFIY